jgi:ribosomal protein S24E
MKMNVVSERQNPYMKRKEIVLEIDHAIESTPSKAVVLELLAKQLSADKEKIEIIDIVSETGLAKSRSSVFLWEEVPVKKIKKSAEKAEAKEAGKEVKQEVKEEKKEEAKKEEKSE